MIPELVWTLLVLWPNGHISAIPDITRDTCADPHVIEQWPDARMDGHTCCVAVNRLLRQQVVRPDMLGADWACVVQKERPEAAGEVQTRAGRSR